MNLRVVVDEGQVLALGSRVIAATPRQVTAPVIEKTVWQSGNPMQAAVADS
jgi:hypothetical protein